MTIDRADGDDDWNYHQPVYYTFYNKRTLLFPVMIEWMTSWNFLFILENIKNFELLSVKNFKTEEENFFKIDKLPV